MLSEMTDAGVRSPAQARSSCRMSASAGQQALGPSIALRSKRFPEKSYEPLKRHQRGLLLGHLIADLLGQVQVGAGLADEDAAEP